jgi:nucleoside-diphosphate-sugar epimerase
LCRPDLNLTASDLRWITQHCSAVIHNAASLTFFGADRRGEPWLSNVEGTRGLLELCGRCRIRQLHHVSTAYVCGLRKGRILETELDVGQEIGNDYERSKLEAEKLIRSAGFENPPTIYRPSIIVGDSRTGYTSTFHGFYAMVKLGHTLASRLVRGSITVEWMIEAFGQSGREGKNFIPVDWVSAVITHLLARPKHHGKTYHLTAPEATPVGAWSRAIQDAVERYSPLADPSDPTHCDAKWCEQVFRREVEVYRAYWQDDPQFDRTYTAGAAPHLPCPTVDYDMLMRMARFAIQTNFGRSPRRRRPPDRGVADHVSRLLTASDIQSSQGPECVHVGLQVNGPGGGQWKLLVRDGRILAAENGICDRCQVVFHLTSETFRRLAAREMSVSQAVNQGRIAITGNGTPAPVLEAVLQTVVTPEDA